jgi:hypothetical protein
VKGAPRSIDLQVFTTNLAHGRPYIFPLEESAPGQSRYRTAERLFFRERELERYLPADVLQWVVDHSQPYQLAPDRVGRDPDEREADGLRELPRSRDFPVLLAARLSLSFPILFSAVPLYAIDYDSPRGSRRFRRCWFTDGGISSNFPMHLFDDLVPTWPTFGIDLEDRIPGREPVFLPQEYREGYGERWSRFAEKRKPASRLGGFLSAMVNAMKNWNDNSLARMPGVRDRVARVRLEEGEGGLNLNMSPGAMASVSEKGLEAARELLKRFDQTAPGEPQARGWDEHRLVRLHVLLKMLEARAPGLLIALGNAPRHVTPVEKLLEQAINDPSLAPTPGYEEPMTPAQRDAVARVVAALVQMAETFSIPANASAFHAVPAPELRVRPPL